MPIVIFERLKSPDTEVAKDPTEDRSTRIYMAIGSWDEEEIQRAIDDTLPPEIPLGIFTLKLQGYRFNHLGNGVWHIEARYSRRDFFDPEFRINTVGGTTHITASRETIERFAVDPAEEPPDYKGAIGVDGKTVHGCDIHTGVFEWEEAHIIPAARVTRDWLKAVKKLCTPPKTNDAPFRIFDTGEVLFLGIQGAIRGADYYQFTFRFAESDNQDEVPIGDTGATIAKQGWEYMWIQFRDVRDDDAKTIVRRPRFAYIERVYDEGDFSVLGLPDPTAELPAGGGGP
jgi:hypothetical protein